MSEEKTAGTTGQDSSTVEQVALDEQGNVRLLVNGEPMSETPDDDHEEEETQGAENDADPKNDDDGTQNGQAEYTPDEIRATDFEKLDPDRIPPNLLPWYKSMQAGFTRKTQELSQRNRELDEAVKFLKDLPAQLKQEQKPVEVDEADLYQRLDVALLGEVAKRFKKDPAEVVELGYDALPQSMKLAYNSIQREWEQKAAEITAKQTEEAEKNATFLATANAFESELRTLDADAYADFDAKIKAGDIPVREVNAIREAIVNNDKKVVADIFEKYRTAYHAGKNGIKTGEKQKGLAPKLETAGNSAQPESKGLPDYSELGRLESFDDKLAWLRKHNIKP